MTGTTPPIYPEPSRLMRRLVFWLAAMALNQSPGDAISSFAEGCGARIGIDRGYLRSLRWMRRTRPSKPVAVAVCVMLFMTLLVIWPFILERVIWAIWDVGIIPLYGSDPYNELPGIFVTLLFDLLISWVIARLTYAKLRWHLDSVTSAYCLQCGYDLTGCVSGICPECGRQVKRLQEVHEILGRRYDSGHADTAARHNEHQP